MAFLHALYEFIAILDDTGFYHFTKKVIAFPGSLPHSGEDGETVVFLCNVVDQFLDEDSLAHTGTTEKTDLSTLEIGLEKIYDLDSCVKDFL